MQEAETPKYYIVLGCRLRWIPTMFTLRFVHVGGDLVILKSRKQNVIELSSVEKE